MVRRSLRLRTRMALSYVAITLAIVLLLEAVVVGSVLYVVTRSPLSGYVALQTASQAAEVMALRAAVQAGDAALSPTSTFEPDQEGSLTLSLQDMGPSLSWFELHVPYVAPELAAPQLRDSSAGQTGWARAVSSYRALSGRLTGGGCPARMLPWSTRLCAARERTAGRCHRTGRWPSPAQFGAGQTSPSAPSTCARRPVRRPARAFVRRGRRAHPSARSGYA